MVERVAFGTGAKRGGWTLRRRAGTAIIGAIALAILLFWAILIVSEARATFSAGFLAMALAGLALFVAVDFFWARPLERLAANIRFLAETRADTAFRDDAYAALVPLPAAIARLAREVAEAQRATDRSVAAATARIEQQKQHLEAILRDLSEGVLVCNLDHRVLLYNQVALALLHVTGDIGLGRSLFGLVTREPVQHALDRLREGMGREGERTTTLVCATVGGDTLLSGRMGLVLDATPQPAGYVLTLTDATRELRELAQRDAIVVKATQGLRRPIANIAAAAETLAAYPAMDAARRRDFDEAILRESLALKQRLEGIDKDARGLGAGRWPLADVHSLDLFRAVSRRLAESGGPALTPVGLPLWINADSYSFALALEALLRKLAEATGVASFDGEALLGDRRVYLEFAWEGEPVPATLLDSWATEPIPGALGSATFADVLARHGSDMWSQAPRPGRAVLRIPMPPSHEPPAVSRQKPAPLPARPEFYDFDLLRLAPGAANGGERKLRFLDYVVFDTETTGLRPSEGDEIVSIGAVRVVNGRILTGETFLRLVNPRRPIPPDSIRFHGITDAMVADAPPLDLVLRQFRTFVADAVLVAHNAAFDLKFLKLKESETGIRFDNVPLDALLMSAFLFPDFDDHSLDGLAARLGIDIVGRHSALGDAMATAAVFVRLLELLEARGVDTLEKLLGASKMAYEIKARQAIF